VRCSGAVGAPEVDSLSVTLAAADASGSRLSGRRLKIRVTGCETVLVNVTDIR